jgi:hypothetical protein
MEVERLVLARYKFSQSSIRVLLTPTSQKDLFYRSKEPDNPELEQKTSVFHNNMFKSFYAVGLSSRNCFPLRSCGSTQILKLSVN